MIDRIRQRFVVTTLLLAALGVGASQAGDADQHPLQWHVEVVPAHAKAGDVVEVVFSADIAPGWILYSSDFALEIGPRPTKFTFETNPAVTPVGAIAPVGSQRRKDHNLRAEYSYFAGHGEFRQKLKLLAPAKSVGVRVDGQTCFEESGLCQLFHENFTAALP